MFVQWRKTTRSTIDRLSRPPDATLGAICNRRSGFEMGLDVRSWVVDKSIHEGHPVVDESNILSTPAVRQEPPGRSPNHAQNSCLVVSTTHYRPRRAIQRYEVCMMWPGQAPTLQKPTRGPQKVGHINAGEIITLDLGHPLCDKRILLPQRKHDGLNNLA